jgi:hypothetical protein
VLIWKRKRKGREDMYITSWVDREKDDYVE